jgi:hypothetical protein
MNDAETVGFVDVQGGLAGWGLRSFLAGGASVVGRDVGVRGGSGWARRASRGSPRLSVAGGPERRPRA